VRRGGTPRLLGLFSERLGRARPRTSRNPLPERRLPEAGTPNSSTSTSTITASRRRVAASMAVTAARR
jgi:hypothetical protein